MYVRSSLEDLQRIDLSYKKIIQVFLENDTELTIPYLIRRVDINQLELYRILQELLELNILIRRDYSICPICNQQDFYEENDFKRCSRCKSIYEINNVVEKFILIRKGLKDG